MKIPRGADACAPARRDPGWIRRAVRTGAHCLVVFLAASCATTPRVEAPPVETPPEYARLFPGVEYRLLRRSEPRPLRIHVVRADMASGLLSIRTPTGADPDGPGPAEASLVDPVRLARDSDALVLVNASAFAVLGYAEGARPAVYKEGMAVDIAGLAVEGGRRVSPSNERYASFYVDSEGRPSLGLRGEEPERTFSPSMAAAGFSPLLVRGALVEDRHRALEPRTAVGFSGDGTFLIVVVEGRRRGVSEGLSLRELALLMRDLGCADALNLDGGGSSVLVVRDGGGYRALTAPTEGYGPRRSYRPIPNALVIAGAR